MAHNLKKWRKLYFHRIILCLCKGLVTNKIPSWPSGLVIKRKLTVVCFSLAKVGGFVDFKSWSVKELPQKLLGYNPSFLFLIVLIHLIIEFKITWILLLICLIVLCFCYLYYCADGNQLKITWCKKVSFWCVI